MEATTTNSARNSQIQAIPVELITPCRFQARSHFDDAALQELAASITSDGLIQPIVVHLRAVPTLTPMYELIAGERRWRAAKLAGLACIAARVMDQLDDATVCRLSLLENLQRTDLDPIEEAQGYAQLNRVAGLKQAEIAAAVSRSQPVIANALRLLELPEAVQEHLRSRRLSAAHGRALGKYAKWPALCEAIATRVIEFGYTSKMIEKGFDHNSEGLRTLRYELERDDLLAGVPSDLPLEVFEAAGGTIFGSGYWGVTPDIDLCKETVQRFRQEQQAEQQRLVQKLRDRAQQDGAAVLKLEKLSWQSYERLGSVRPKACGPTCACFAQAIDRGGHVVDICTDPKQLKKLKTAEIRDANKDRKEVARLKAEELDRLLEEMPPYDTRGLALVVAHHLWQFPKAVGKRLLTQFASGVVEPSVLDSYDTRRDTYARLVTLPFENLVQIMVHGKLLDEMGDFVAHGSAPPGLTWYLEQAGKQVLPTDRRALKRQLSEARANVGRYQSQPKVAAAWQATAHMIEGRLATIDGSTRSDNATAAAATSPTDNSTEGGLTPEFLARTVLGALLVDYGILDPEDRPTDSALLEFGADLLVMPHLSEHQRAIAQQHMGTLQAAVAEVM